MSYVIFHHEAGKYQGSDPIGDDDHLVQTRTNAFRFATAEEAWSWCAALDRVQDMNGVQQPMPESFKADLDMRGILGVKTDAEAGVVPGWLKERHR